MADNPISNVSVTTSVSVEGSVSLTTNLDQQRTGVQHTIREQIDTESLGDRVVSRNIITFTRSRNIEFTATRMKPYTQVYAFFDNIDVTNFCTPKLLEIEMISGTFSVGEDIRGTVPLNQITQDTILESLPDITFRSASINHKYGPFNAPTATFTENPYDRNIEFPLAYSESSTLLNIDTFSLSNDNQYYYGFIRPGMILVGRTSNARARVTNVRLVTDNIGTLIGSFLIPDGNVRGNPIFETGRNTFRLTSSSTNTRIEGITTTTAEEVFYSQGDIDNTQEVTLSLRNARVSQQDFNQRRTLTSSTTARANSGTVSGTGSATIPQPIEQVIEPEVVQETQAPREEITVSDPCPDARTFGSIDTDTWRSVLDELSRPNGRPRFRRVKFRIDERFLRSSSEEIIRPASISRDREERENIDPRFRRDFNDIGSVLTARGTYNVGNRTLNGQPYQFQNVPTTDTRSFGGRSINSTVRGSTFNPSRENTAEGRRRNTYALFDNFLATLPTGSLICVDVRDLPRSSIPAPEPDPPYTDPLAQSFFVNESSGIFVTKLGVFFRTKDSGNAPVTCQIREMKLGLPSDVILAYSEVSLTPDLVSTSDDASVETSFIFDSPVYLGSNKEYAIVLLSPSTEYNVWISRFGEFDVSTGGADAVESERILVSSQPLLGTLYKSQNASTWTPSQYEDLKFNLYRANFIENGSVQFFNPSTLPRETLKLTKDPFDVDSRRIRLGIGTTTQDSDLESGNTIIQLPSGASGSLVGTAGSISALSINNSGIGYTPSIGDFTFNNITLQNIIGSGNGASANITISDGVAIAATIRNGGYGYSVGDVLTSGPIGVASLGRNIRLNVSELGGFNELILDDVQGEFVTGIGQTIYYVNSLGITTSLNSNVGSAVTVTSFVEVTDGLHFKVFHRNHGMLSDSNRVTISGAKSDIQPTTLSVEYESTSNSSIVVSNVTGFSLFEGVGVAITNPGYAIIKDEIIKYTGVSTSTNELTGITRGINSTQIDSYPENSLIYKYEMNGVSLIRINKTHILSDSDINDPIGLDYYYLKVDMSDTDPETIDRTGSGGFQKLHFSKNIECGGSSIEATYNIPFEIIEPYFGVITPQNTTVTSLARTITGKSVNGTETPFVDKGFQPITLNNLNYFDSPRVIASPINEANSLQGLPGSKSFTINLNLVSEDNRVSPAIDLEKTSVRLISNRINSVITDYANDGRVNSLTNDPNDCYYVSKPISLENPATSIKVLLSASISQYNDIRVFYSIQKSLSETPIFVPFPGYSNLRPDGFVIDQSQNNGESDRLVPKNSLYEYEPSPKSFKEYEYTVDNLTPFNIFRVKIILTSTNQAYVPIVQDLRAIALA